MTDEQRAEIKRLAEAATPGPWKTGDLENRSVCDSDGWGVAEGMPGSEGGVSQCVSNAAFIAAANPTAVLDLLAENERLRAEIQRMHDEAGYSAYERELMTD